MHISDWLELIYRYSNLCCKTLFTPTLPKGELWCFSSRNGCLVEAAKIGNEGIKWEEMVPKLGWYFMLCKCNWDGGCLINVCGGEVTILVKRKINRCFDLSVCLIYVYLDTCHSSMDQLLSIASVPYQLS